MKLRYLINFLILSSVRIIFTYTVNNNSLLYVEVEMALAMTSSAFNNGGEIPSIYTCEGENISPPLAWSGIPDRRKAWY